MDENELNPNTNRITPIPFVGIIIIAALLSGGGVYGYQYSQQKKSTQNLQAQIDTLNLQLAEAKVAAKTPTAGWLTYTNTTLSISFKYPKDYVVEVKKGIASPNTLYISNYPQSKLPDIASVPKDWVALDVIADAKAEQGWNAGLSYTQQKLPSLVAKTEYTTDGKGKLSYYEFFSSQVSNYSLEAGNGRLDQLDVFLKLSNGNGFRARNIDNYDWTPTGSDAIGRTQLLEILRTVTSI